MKRLFIVGCKIMGLLQLYYWAFTTLWTLGLAIDQVRTSVDPSVGWLICLSLYSILAFAMPYFLIFHTELLARFVGVEERDEGGTSMSQQDALKTGLILIGAYFVLASIRGLAAVLVNLARWGPSGGSVKWLGETIGYGCQIGLGVLLVRWPDKVLAFISRRRKDAKQPA